MSKPLSRCLLLLLSVIMLAPAGGLAAPALNPAQTQFLQLYEQARRGRYDDVRAEAEALRDYLLFPYLEGADLERRLRGHVGETLDRRLADFLARYPDLALSDSLRSSWLRSLGERREWRQYLAHYPASTEDAELRCHHTAARIALGQETGVFDDARALWLSGERRPEACEPVFDWLERSGRLTPALRRERLELAMAAGQAGLVRSLAGKLSEAEQKRAARWADLQRRPLDTLERLARERDPAVDASVLDYGVRKAARSDSAAVAALFPALMKTHAPDAAHSEALLGYLALQLALDRRPEATEWFSRLRRPPDDPTVREWRIRSALYQGEWAMARAWIGELPAAERGQERWRYWLARSLEAGGGEQAQQQARAIYAELAAQRGYYPYLAADRIQRGYTIRDVPVPADKTLRQRLAAQPAAQRAQEFVRLDLLAQARAEWKKFITGLGAAELRQAALIARDWGWHPQAIITLAQAEYWDDMQLRYPLLYRSEVLAATREQSLDPGWIYGIMRSESLFVPDARSGANALGLLQLLPGTARQMSRRLGLGVHSEAAILVPGNNIRLGAAYLRDMLGRFKGHYGLASAAYNAGPARVQQWLPARPLPADVWVENIPFNETRAYVQRVMEHAVAFEWRLGRSPVSLATRMPTVPTGL